MVDIEGLGVEWLVRSVPKSRNTSPLIAHLRRHGRVTPALSDLLADLLEGKVKASPKPLTIKDVSKHWVRANLDHYKAILRGEEGDEAWDMVATTLRENGIDPVPKTKGETTAAAKFLTASAFGLTASQLDEVLSPRTARLKNR